MLHADMVAWGKIKGWAWAAILSSVGVLAVANLNHTFARWRGDTFLTAMIEGISPALYAVATSYWGQIGVAVASGVLIGMWVDAIGRRWDERRMKAPAGSRAISSNPGTVLIDDVCAPPIDGDAPPVFEGWALSGRDDYDFKPDRLSLRACLDDAKIEIFALVVSRNSGRRRLVVRRVFGELCINDIKGSVKSLDGEAFPGGRQEVEFNAISNYLEREYISGRVILCLDFGYSELEISNRFYAIWKFENISFPDRKHEKMTIGYMPHVSCFYYRRINP